MYYCTVDTGLQASLQKLRFVILECQLLKGLLSLLCVQIKSFLNEKEGKVEIASQGDDLGL